MKIKLKGGTTDIALLTMSGEVSHLLKKELNPFMGKLDDNGVYEDPETAALYYHIFTENDFVIQFDCIEMIKMELDFAGITGVQCDSLNFELGKFMGSDNYKKWLDQ